MDLDSQQVELLTSINELDRTVAPEKQDTTRLRLMKQAYNELAEKIRLQKHLFDPLSILPPELWLRILLMAIRPESRWTALRTFMLVSKQWHKCVTETPLLWTRITLGERYGDMQDAMLAKFLHLSQQSMLHLTLDVHLKSWETICDTISPHRSRIKSIQFFRISVDNQREQILQRLSPLTHLTSLYGYEEIGWLLEQGSPIERITGGVLSQAILSLPEAANLRDIGTEEDIQVILNLAQNLPLLESIRFFPQDYWGTDLTYLEPASILSEMPEVLNWRSIFYETSSYYFPLWLLNRLPQLAHLSLRLPFAQVEPLLMGLSHLPSLTSLEITLLSGWGSFSPAALTISPCPSVEILSVVCTHRGSMYPSASFKRLVELLVDSFPNILSLSFLGNGLCAVYMALKSAGFQRLHKMKLLDPSFIPQSPQDLDLPLLKEDAWFPQSLQQLTVTHRNFNVSHIYCTTIRSLEVSPVLDSKEEYDISQWPQLTDLKLYAYNLPRKRVFHQNLRTIVMMTKSRTIKEANNVTRFCRDLALDPSSMPSLTDMSLGEIFEWDILFIMLERRNFYPQPGVVRIKKIDIRNDAKEFRQPLRDLLSGLYTRRPSNRELSMASNADRLFDASM